MPQICLQCAINISHYPLGELDCATDTYDVPSDVLLSHLEYWRLHEKRSIVRITISLQ